MPPLEGRASIRTGELVRGSRGEAPVEAWRARNIAVANASIYLYRERDIARQIVAEQTAADETAADESKKEIRSGQGTAAYNVERCGTGTGICSWRGR